MPVKINWETIDDIKEGSGDGVEIYYEKSIEHHDKILLAFVVGFGWYHKTSDNVTVQLLSTESPKFIERDLAGAALISEIKKSLPWYLQRRRVPLKRLGKKFVTWINT